MERLHGVLATFVFVDFYVNQGELDVLDSRGVWDQVKALEDELEVAPAQYGEFVD